MRAEEADLEVRKGRSMLLLSFLTLAVGIAASVVSFWFVRTYVENEAKLKFERQASDAHNAIEARISSYSDIMYGLRALFHSAENVSSRQFHDYIAGLDLPRRFPGVVVINFAQHVLGKDKEAFESRVRNDTSLNPNGNPAFQIKPPGNRPFYHVLVYLEPLAGNEVALGRDILMQPGRKATFEQLLTQLSSTADLSSSGRPVVIEGPNPHWATAMRLPIYGKGAALDTAEARQSALRGTLGTGIRIRELMQNVLDKETLDTLRFRIFEAGAAAEYESRARDTAQERLLLFDSQASPNVVPGTSKGQAVPPPSTDDHLRTVLPLTWAGRVWEVEFSSPLRTLISTADAAFPWLVLVAGIIISLLLYGIAQTLSTSRSRAMALARHITRDLRESEASLAEAQSMAHLGNWSLDLQSRSMDWSDETYRILGLPPRIQPPSYEKFLELVHADDRARLEAALSTDEPSAEDELEYRLALEDRSIRWVHALIRRNSGQVVQGTLMDITERRRAQEELQSYAERLRSVSRRLLEVQEAERRMLASELHDRVGQSLTALGLNLSIMDRLSATDAKAGLASRLADSSLLVEQTMDAMRNVMGELRPQGLDEYGLSAPLRALAADFSQRTGIRVEFDGSGSPSRVRSNVALAMFRIAQEALNNISKHSKATVVQVSFAEKGGRATLTISDNGAGFDARRMEKPGWGLLIMRERAEAVGARFSLDANPGGGTRVMVDYRFREEDAPAAMETSPERA